MCTALSSQYSRGSPRSEPPGCSHYGKPQLTHGFRRISRKYVRPSSQSPNVNRGSVARRQLSESVNGFKPISEKEAATAVAAATHTIIHLSRNSVLCPLFVHVSTLRGATWCSHLRAHPLHSEQQLRSGVQHGPHPGPGAASHRVATQIHGTASQGERTLLDCHGGRHSGVGLNVWRMSR